MCRKIGRTRNILSILWSLTFYQETKYLNNYDFSQIRLVPHGAARSKAMPRAIETLQNQKYCDGQASGHFEVPKRRETKHPELQ